MSFTQPQYITMAFAQDGDKTPIGDTPSLTQPSQPIGFPVIYSTPIADDGKPITRVQFNGIMNLYSQFILWNNVGGTYSWNADIAATGYPLGAVIWYNNTQIRSAISSNATEPSPATVSAQGTDWVYVAPYVEYQLPVGSLIQIPLGITAPIGYILANGSAVSRTTYANLFAVYGTTFGAGDGSTTFELPDFRGKFIRGQSGNSADYGVTQNDAIRNITGTMGGKYLVGDSIIQVTGAFYNAGTFSENAFGGTGSSPKFGFDASLVVPTADENRPVNLAVDFYIKY